MPFWSWIKRLKATLSERPGTAASPPEEFREIRLQRTAPPGSEQAPELCFVGRKLIEVEEEWDNELNIPLRPNSIGLVNRLAIYEERDEAVSRCFVAEQLRFNVGPVITPPGVPKHELFVSLSQQFSSFVHCTFTTTPLLHLGTAPLLQLPCEKHFRYCSAGQSIPCSETDGINPRIANEWARLNRTATKYGKNS